MNAPTSVLPHPVELIRMRRISPDFAYADVRLPGVHLRNIAVPLQRNGTLSITPPSATGRDGRLWACTRYSQASGRRSRPRSPSCGRPADEATIEADWLRRQGPDKCPPNTSVARCRRIRLGRPRRKDLVAQHHCRGDPTAAGQSRCGHVSAPRHGRRSMEGSTISGTPPRHNALRPDRAALYRQRPGNQTLALEPHAAAMAENHLPGRNLVHSNGGAFR